jgi:hypothetical protein
MIILVDYDNIEQLDRGRGVTHVVERIVRSVGSALLGQEARVRVRLYGGWFDDARLSRSAQLIIPKLQSDFPRPISVSDAAGSARVVANVELARSLECDPTAPLLRTYRPRSPQANLQVFHLPFKGCLRPASCQLAVVDRLISHGQCVGGCATKMEDVLFRAEQKLVDTMLVADMLHFAIRHQEILVVVSSDDDIWPGIHASIINGAQVVHVHTASSRATPAHYSRLISGKYSQCSM